MINQWQLIEGLDCSNIGCLKNGLEVLTNMAMDPVIITQLFF